MRLVLVLCLVAGAVIFGAIRCSAALAPNEALKAVVEASLLPGMARDSCEWGSSTYENEPKSWYGCWGYVSGDLSRVGRAVESGLRSQGFDVSTNRTDFTFELTAVRAAETVCVDVLAPGFSDGRNTDPDEIDPDAGEVFVDVWTAEPRDGGSGLCDELPAWEDE